MELVRRHYPHLVGSLDHTRNPRFWVHRAIEANKATSSVLAHFCVSIAVVGSRNALIDIGADTRNARESDRAPAVKGAKSMLVNGSSFCKKGSGKQHDESAKDREVDLILTRWKQQPKMYH